MIRDFLENKIGFGINLCISSKNYDAGCMAKSVEIIKKYDDGRMDIIVSGGRRYNIKNIKKCEFGYSMGEADFYEDITQSYDDSTLVNCLNTYNDIINLLKNDGIKEIKKSELKTEKPSFYIAQKSGLTALQKQHILELKSENERLMSILLHLQKVFPALKEADAVNRIIKNDGYFVNK